MKKVLLLILSTALIFGSCNKWDDSPVTGEKQDVVFTSIETSINSLKASETCDNPIAHYAKITIASPDPTQILTFTPQVFYIDDLAYTQAIKLDVGTWTVTEFSLWNDNGTPELTDDVEVMAVPEAGSAYAEFTSNPVPFNTEVTAFHKNEIPIQVFCFEPANYSAFGFSWFTVDHIILREKVFFGDLCVKKPEDYSGSIYINQDFGVQPDMPAIFKIIVYTVDDQYNNKSWVATFSNAAWWGEGEPLKVQYVDQEGVDDYYQFDLHILVQDGTGFSYKLFHSWFIKDDDDIPAGADNVIDFVLGNCDVAQADLVLPPYMNLPETATYKMTKWGSDAELPLSYADAILSNIPQGYELYDGEWPSWCGDKQTTIQLNHAYDMDVYSSLYPDLIPAFVRHDDNGVNNPTDWAQVNWLMNNLGYYPDATMLEIQEAIWDILDYSIGNTTSNAIAKDALDYGSNYVPLPGGWAAVLFVPHGTDIDDVNADIQTMFIRVDP